MGNFVARLVMSIAMLAGVPSGAGAAEPGPAEIYARTAPAVFSLTAIGPDGERSIASAFAVGEGLVATSYHAVSGASRILLESIVSGEVFGGATLHATNSANDLAVLAVPSVTGPAIGLRRDLPAIGEPVLVIGSPEGLEGSLSDGLVAGFRRLAGKRLLQITAPVEHGNSGGPVLDAAGSVVGIVHARAAGRSSIGFATPAARIAELLAGHSLAAVPASGAEAADAPRQEALSHPGGRASPAGRSLDAWRSRDGGAGGDGFTIGIADWDSADAAAYILAETVRRAGGPPVRFIEGSIDTLFARMDAGEVDVIADVWLPNHQALVDTYVEGRGTARLGGLLYTAIQGLCVPRHTRDTLGLHRVDQLADPVIAARFDRDGDARGELWAGEADWHSTGIERVKARDHGYEATFDLVTGTEEQEWQTVLDALTLRRHRVFYCYAPHWITGRPDIALLDEPPHSPDCFRFVRPQDDERWLERSTARCRAPRETVHIAVGTHLEATQPALYTMLTEAIRIPVGAVQEWLRAVKQQRRDPRRYTDDWMRHHEPLVAEWLEAGLQAR